MSDCSHLIHYFKIFKIFLFLLLDETIPNNLQFTIPKAIAPTTITAPPSRLSLSNQEWTMQWISNREEIKKKEEGVAKFMNLNDLTVILLIW